MLAASGFPGAPLLAQAGKPADLNEMDLGDLMNLKVTSVSKREQKFSRTAAPVFVIGQEDIRRSGATSLPDLPRMVPGLDVGRINSNTWAISSRGFNGEFSNKLLVLIDGRTVYDPSFSGIYWEVQDTLLEDIDRIEIIRGPGATIWGSNAVNGVINIITKKASDTQGCLASADLGSIEQIGSTRCGGEEGRAAYRVFGRYRNLVSSKDLSRAGYSDGSHINRGGFRLDWNGSDRDSTTLEGDVYRGDMNLIHRGRAVPGGALAPQTFLMDVGGGDMLARWNHTFAGGSQLSAQVYFDRLTRVDIMDPELRSTLDFDLREHTTLGRHEIVWGTGYRRNWDRLSSGLGTSFTPPSFQSSVTNGFVQDEITLAEDRLWLTVGGKLEHNVFTGVESEPSASLMWAPSERHSFWFSAARASKIPARNDTDISYGVAGFPTQTGLPALLRTFGNARFQSEKLTALEAGYRNHLSKRVALDLTGFHNHYRHLRSFETGAARFMPGPSPYLLIPLNYDNKMFGDTYGAEAYAEFEVTRVWTLKAGHTWFVPALRLEQDSTDTTLLPENQGNAPRNQSQVRSQLNLPHHLEWDVTLYRVGRLRAGNIPAYSRLDTRVGWRPRKQIDLAVVGQGLLRPAQAEFYQTEQKLLTTRIERDVHVSLTWHF